jgi:hypothetical protein
MSELPTAGSVPLNVKDDFRAQAAARGLVGAASNTKWDELIAFIRDLEGWRPSYRSKAITGYISGWDVEWSYHLPTPFSCVQWLDIGLKGLSPLDGVGKRKIVDHSTLIILKIAEIGFEYEVRGDIVRIWGYLPKCHEDFPPNGAA